MQEEKRLTIATATSRMSKEWTIRAIGWGDLKRKLSFSKDTGETMAEYLALPKEQQDVIKDIGGFVGGSLRDGLRRNGCVESRSLVTLDLDDCPATIVESLGIGMEWEAIIYSTHKSTAAKPRIRLVIPLSRDVTPDEYEPLARKIAADSLAGMECFDPTTYEAARLMYWPSRTHDEKEIFKEFEGPLCDPDEVLKRYDDWRDASEWPTSKKELKRRPGQPGVKLSDPAEKPGTIGAFCAAHPISDAIAQFLSETYLEAGDGRYTFAKGSTTGGAIVYGDKFLYSNHATDPARGQSLNAFDLCRIHLFGQLDEKAKEGTPAGSMPSFRKMEEFARNDSKTKEILVKKMADAHPEAKEDFGEFLDKGPEKSDDWMKKLTLARGSKYAEDTYDNATLIMESDPNLKGLVGENVFRGFPEILKKSTPWKRSSSAPTWTDADDAQLRIYLSHVYGIKNRMYITDALTAAMEHNAFDPVKQYIESVQWDGEKRIERVLIDYLGAEDSDYVRTVTRKMLVAAVARVFEPGKKFDYMVTLVGPQGVGKSLLIYKLGNGWTSDTLPDLRSKQAYESLDGVWLMEMAELVALKKADRETIKNFVSKTEDTYRKAYARNVSVNRRRCIFIGTTNDGSFLNDSTGARRFLVIDCDPSRVKTPVWKGLGPDEVHQIWAEAKSLYDKGERIMDMPDHVAEKALQEQESHTDDDPMLGAITVYLEERVPNNWKSLNMDQRVQWYKSTDEYKAQQATAAGVDGEPVGLREREAVCAQEIWVECFGKKPSDMTRIDSKRICETLAKIPGWKQDDGTTRVGPYGPQRCFKRQAPGKEGK